MLHANGALRAASISAGERKWVTLLFKAVKDVVPIRHVVGDGATLLAPVNRDPVAGTHEGLLAVPCYILTCPISRWRAGRVVEGAALEMLYRGNSIEGSNPSLSASPVRQDRIFFALFEA